MKKHAARATVVLVAAITLSANAAGASAPSKPHNCGQASWYQAGHSNNPKKYSKTASGEKLVDSLFTAAHREYAFGTMLKVSNSSNGKSVIVKVNDRGPFKKGRIIDLSKSAAQQIGLVQSGTANVCTTVVPAAAPAPAAPRILEALAIPPKIVH